MEPINLDDATDSELESIRVDMEQPLDYRLYARYTLGSRAARRRGDVRIALDGEDICQGIYNRLPEALKW